MIGSELRTTAVEKLREGIALLVVAASLAATAGFLWGVLDNPTWRAQAELQIGPSSEGRIDPAQLATLVSSEQVATDAAGRLGGDVAGADLLSQIRATATDGGAEVVATSELASYAVAAADAFAEATADLAVQREQRRLRRSRDRLRNNLAEIDPGSAEAEELAGRVGELDQALAEPDAVEVVSPARTPSEPLTNRSALVWTLGGALAGLLLGAGWLLLRRPRSEPISSVPGLEAPGREVVEVPSSRSEPAGLEVSGLLRRLSLGESEQAPGVVAVTAAAGGGERRSAVASAIALSVAARGLKVLLVDCDLQSPRQADHHRVAGSPGLADYLRGRAGPREVLRSLPLPGDREGGRGVAVVLPAGEVDGGDPLALLSSDLFSTLISRTSQVYELVVLDVAAIAATAAQAATCVSHADAAVLVCERGRTRPDGLARAATVLGGIEPALTALVDPPG